MRSEAPLAGLRSLAAIPLYCQLRLGLRELRDQQDSIFRILRIIGEGFFKEPIYNLNGKVTRETRVGASDRAGFPFLTGIQGF